jgi:tRNA A-37 threonylcarbamoyl transferase component Bud32
MTAVAVEIGQRIADRYRVISVIARGGMGAVYEAIDERLDRRVAIKVLLQDLVEDRTIAARFEREARAAARLSHPSIVQVFDFGIAADGAAYLVLERVVGRTLATILGTEGRVAPARAADIVEQALGALATAHASGIVHRDIKPPNLMVVASGVGDRELVKVLDFGIAQLKTGTAYTRLTSTGMILGTPAFMAPEQARGEATDARVDVYAMGVVLYCLLTGVSPFHSRDIAEVVMRVLEHTPPRADAIAPGVPPSLAAIAERAMQKRAEHRFPSADAFALALFEWRRDAAHAPVATPAIQPIAEHTAVRSAISIGPPAEPAPVATTVRPSARRSWWVIAIGASLIVAAGLCVAIVLALRVGDAGHAPRASNIGSSGVPPSTARSPAYDVGWGLPVVPGPRVPECERAFACCVAFYTAMLPSQVATCDDRVVSNRAPNCTTLANMFEASIRDTGHEVPSECR